MRNALKALSIVVTLAMVLAFTACGSESDQTGSEGSSGAMAGMANPVHQCSAEEMEKATGIPLEAPEGAEDVSYSYIDSVENSPVSQVVFTLDDNEFTYRARATSNTSITDVTDEEVDAKDLASALNAGVNIGNELSGMYGEGSWDCAASTLVSDRDAVIAFNKGKEGFISWIDVVPGVQYSLSVDKNADQDMLTDTAEKVFVELQGDN